ncbi:MAG: hypothetical protein KC613_12975 [Myxococcales bacterium]|nr:hypothetical protein [Myxococcales bacterium]
MRAYIIGLGLFLSACGAHRPPTGPQRALYDDVRAVVVHEQRTEWVSDRLELEQMGPRLLHSGCQTPADERAALAAWLAGRIAADGGPAAKAFAANGGDLSAVQDLLLLDRVATSLRYIQAHAGECPFWLPEDPGFAGVQSNTGRFVLMAESIGGAQVVFRDGETTLGGAGGGRILPGYGLSDRLTLAGGVELGGTSTFPKDADGNRTVKPAWAYGVPVLLQVHSGSWRFDTEATLTARAAFESPDDLRFGVRVAQAAGVTTPRIAGVMPYVMLWVGHEWLPAVDGQDDVQIMRLGTRVGVNWDP